MPVAVTATPVGTGAASGPLLDIAKGQVRRAADGWHAVLRIDAVDHRVWSRDPPSVGAYYIAELSFDGDFGARAYAARRLWRAMNGRAPGPALHELSKQRRERLTAVLRALDAHSAGGTYRVVSEALFGKKRVLDRSWKDHDLRSQIIRLVKSGIALTRGGYRALLRPSSRKK